MVHANRKTIKTDRILEGIGVHSGRRVCIHLKPAPAGHGIVFHVQNKAPIKAHWSLILDSRSATTLGHCKDVSLGMVEHLLSACYGLGITDLTVSTDAQEMPILDGGAMSYGLALQAAQSVILDAPAPRMVITAPFLWQSGNQCVMLLPGPTQWQVYFPLTAQTVQSACFDPQTQDFMKEIAPARTFVQYDDIERLTTNGYIKGGSLDCALVLQGDTPLNPGGFRMPEECARHKLLDLMGDLALSGLHICGKIIAYNPSHAFNAQVLRRIFRSEAPLWYELLDVPGEIVQKAHQNRKGPPLVS